MPEDKYPSKVTHNHSGKKKSFFASTAKIKCWTGELGMALHQKLKIKRFFKKTTGK